MKTKFQDLWSKQFSILLFVLLPIVIFKALELDHPRVPTIGGYAYIGNGTFLLQTSFLYLCLTLPLIFKRYSKWQSRIRIANPENEINRKLLDGLNVSILSFLLLQICFFLAYRLLYSNDLTLWLRANQNKVIMLFLITIVALLINKVRIRGSIKESFPILNLFLLTFALSLKNISVEFDINRFIFLGTALGIILFGISSRYGTIVLKNRALDFLIIIPVTAFMTFATVPRNYALHPYESMSYSNYNLVQGGQLPWKNFELEHGIWTDLLRNVLSSYITGDQSFWAQSYAYSFLIRPIEVVLFLISLRLITRSIEKTLIIFLGLRFIEMFFGLAFWSSPQVTPVLYITYALFIFFEKRTQKRLLGLGICLGISILWAPESLYSLIAVVFMLTFYSLPGLINLSRQLAFLFLSILLTVFILLQPFALFLPFLKSNFAISNGYNFAWADRIHFEFGFVFSLLVIMIPISVICILTDFLRASKDSHSAIHKALGVPIIVTIFFYWKFLQWPDWHLLTPSTLLLTAIAIAFVLSTKILSPNSKIFYYVLSIILVAPMISSPTLILESKKPQQNLNFEYASESTQVYINRINQVRETFSPYLKENSKVFDFGNEPLTWFGYLEFHSAASISKALNVNSFETEELVVRELASDPSSAVIWGSEFGYSNYPFGPTFVRKPVIASYVLKHYSPVAIDGGYILFTRKGLFPVSDPAKSDLMRQDCSLRFNLNLVNYENHTKSQKPDYGNVVSLKNPNQFFNYEMSFPTTKRIFFNTKSLDKGIQVDMSYCPAWVYLAKDSKWKLEKIRATQ